MAQVAHVLVVGAVVHEHPQIHPDLVGGQAHPSRRVHRGEQVLDEVREAGAEVRDVPAGLAQHRVAEQG